MLKFDELSGDSPMARLHNFLIFFLENGKYMGKGTLNTVTDILPNKFELPQFQVLGLQMQLLCLLILNFA